MKLNKKEYNDTGFFQKKYIEEYCNLNIYPKINEIETEAGLLSDIAEAFAMENSPATFDIYGDSKSEAIQFLQDNLLNSVNISTIVIAYIDYAITRFTNLKYISVLLAPEHCKLDHLFFRKVKKAGIKLYAHTGAIARHIKRFSYDDNFYKMYWDNVDKITK